MHFKKISLMFSKVFGLEREFLLGNKLIRSKKYSMLIALVLIAEATEFFTEFFKDSLVSVLICRI